MSQIGPIVGGDTIAVAVLDTLKKWMPTYLAEIERQRNIDAGRLPAVAAWQLMTVGQRRLPDWPCPAVAVIPLTGAASGASTDHVHGLFTVQINTFVETNSWESTALTAARYTAAVRACLLQQSTLGGVAQTVEWLDETYRGVEIDDTSFRGGGVCIVGVHTPNSTKVRPVLTDPSTSPPTPPAHRTSEITVRTRDTTTGGSHVHVSKH